MQVASVSFEYGAYCACPVGGLAHDANMLSLTAQTAMPFIPDNGIYTSTWHCIPVV
jgi:hypothetical protein